MNISKPGNFQGAFGNAKFVLNNADPQETIEVSVAGKDGMAVGYKRLTGETTYIFGVGNYVADQFDIKPYAGNTIGLGTAKGRVAQVSVEAAGQESGICRLTAGALDAKPLTPLSEYDGIRTLSMQESDEIMFVNDDKNRSAMIEWEFRYEGHAVGYSVPMTLTADTMYYLNVGLGDMENILGDTAENIVENIHGIYVSMYLGGETVKLAEYRVVKPRKDSVRLYWINRYGAVDSYTFALATKENMQMRGNNVVMEDERRKMAVSSHRTMELISYYETRRTLKWLADIVAAPKVWMISRNEATPVCAESDSVVYGGKNRRISLIVSYSEIEPMQKL